MEYFMNLSPGGKMTASAENPDEQAALTLVIRSGSSYQIGEMLVKAKEYVTSHDVQLEAIAGAFSKIAMSLGYQTINTTLASSILKRSE